MIKRIALALFVVFLSACAQSEDQAAQSALSTPPVAVVRGEELPDRLLFVQNGRIWLWEDGVGRPLFGNGEAWQARFSPDGTQIAFVERANSSSDIVLADSSGSSLQRLTDNGSQKAPNSLARAYESRWALYPNWASDGATLVFASQAAPPSGEPAAEYNLGLYRIAVSASRPEPLYSNDSAQVGRSIYTPDGNGLIFVATETSGTGQQRLVRLALSDRSAEPVIAAPTPSYDPAFSADGAWLAFAANEGERTDIYALLEGGASGTPLRLTDLGTARAPAFSPDGQHLAFLALDAGGGFDIWVANISEDAAGSLRASSPRQVTSGLHLDADSGLSWAP